MPCYHPLIRCENLSKWEKAADGHKYHPAIILGQEKLNDLEEFQKYIGMGYKQQIIPCGNCIGCRLDYSREWANRGYLESKLYDANYFVTITYDENNLKFNTEITTKNDFTFVQDESWQATLEPKHLTQFIKNIRQIMKRDYNQDGIRFMACGEYGEENERPHYHIIFFNLNLPAETFYNPRVKNGNTYWQNTIIERAWGKGICNVSDATWNSIAYTARYITKKINGELSEEAYAEKGQTKEFFRVSRNPGIGQPYYDLHKDEIYKNDRIIVKTTQGVVSSQPPHYFDKLYKEENPEKFKSIQQKREKESQNTSRLKSMMTSLLLREQLVNDEEAKKAQTAKLRRMMEKGG